MNFATRYAQNQRRIASLSPAVRATLTDDRANRLRFKQMVAGIGHAHTKRTTQQ